MGTAEHLSEEIVDIFPEEWVQRVDKHQHDMAALGYQELINNPFPESATDEEKHYAQQAKEYAKEYDEAIEALLDTDAILASLYKEAVHIHQNYTEIVRARRNVAAYIIFAAAKDHTIAS